MSSAIITAETDQQQQAQTCSSQCYPATHSSDTATHEPSSLAQEQQTQTPQPRYAPP